MKKVLNERLTEHILLIYALGDSKLRYNGWKPIYHYTSPNGLLGILQKEKPILWFSRFDSLNDTSEGTYIVDVYKNVCEKLYEKQEIDKPFYVAIKDIQPDVKEVFSYKSEFNANETKGKCQEFESYICSFSKTRDSLPMWNYYSKNNRYEGYNIGFSFNNTQDTGVQSSFEKGYFFSLLCVIYNNEKQEEIIREEILRFYKEIEDFENEIQSIKTAVAVFLKDLSLIFKKPFFAHEKEIRAVIRLPKEEHKDFPVKYRNMNGYIVPYIEVAFEKEDVCGITIAPLHNDVLAKNNLEKMMVYFGYNLTLKDIKNSEIPIRY